MIPEAANIRVDLTDDIRVLKQATCSYCICSRPGEDLGSLVECKTCLEGYHRICMGISEEKAAALEASDEGFKCIRCRISTLFTSAEQAMLTAMKRWMPSTCFAEQAGFNEVPLADSAGAYPSSSLVVDGVGGDSPISSLAGSSSLLRNPKVKINPHTPSTVGR